MKKKDLLGDTLKERLLAGSRDKMHRFLLEDGTVRGAVIQGIKLVHEMRANHELGVLETLALGHAYMGALLMASKLKGADRIGVKITCDGPIEGLSVEANAFGEVRGYLFRNPIPVHKPVNSFDLSPFFGAGILSVTRFLEQARNPFTGQIRLEYGNIAEDLANFAAKSEQIPSAFNLSIKFDPEGTVVGAGGLIVEALPGADPDILWKLQEIVSWLPSIGESFEDGVDPESYVLREFADFGPTIIGSRRVEFMCHCNRHRFERFVANLPASDLEDILANGPFPLVLTCHNCNTSYEVEKAQIERIYHSGDERRGQ